MRRRLLIVPTLDHVDDALASADEPLRALTIASVEAAVAALALPGRRRLSASGRRLALGEILRSADNLPAFQSVSHSPGFASIVESFLLETEAGDISSAVLNDVSRWGGPGLRRRLLALAQIAEAYEKRLAQRGLVDASFAMAAACARLQAKTPLPPLLAGYDEIVFDHIIEWSPGRVRLLKAICAAQVRAGGIVRVQLPKFPSDTEVGEVIAPAEKAIQGSEAAVEELAFIDPGPLPTRIEAFDAADDAGEAREVARRVLQQIRAGAPAGEIAIAANGMRDLALRLRRCLSDLGVPSRSSVGIPLARSHVAHLAATFAGWGPPEEATRETVCALLGSRAINLRVWAESEISANEIIRHIRAAAVRSRVPDRQGRDGFASRLERYARSLEADSAPVAERVRRSSAVLARFFERVDARPIEGTLLEHGRELVTLLEELGATRWMQQVGTGSIEADEALALEQAAWNHLLEALRDIEDSSQALGLRERPVSRAFFAQWIEQTFGGGSFHPGTSRGSGVELLELADVAGRRFRHVFIVGAYDGRLPRGPARDALFTDDERWSINALFGRPVLRVAPSPTQSSPFPAASLLDAASLALAARAGRDGITLSRPRSDDRGKPLADSPLLSLFTPKPLSEHVSFVPLDAWLGSRSSPSILERQRIAGLRAATFRGEPGAEPWGGYIDGIAATLQPLAAGRRDLPWSASALEKLSNCGFRYLAEWAWRAREIMEPEDEPGVMEVGRIAHLAAEVAARAMVQAGVWSRKSAVDAVLLGIRTAAETLSEAEQETVLGHPEAWDITRTRMLRRLGLMLEREIERTEELGVVPYAMELGFGVREAELPALEVGGTYVGGQIDRVDIGPSSVMVLDYKSGRTINNVKRFADDKLFDVQLQLPLYVAAVHHLLPQTAGKKIDAVYVSLRDTKRSKTLNDAVGGATAEQISERLDQAVREISARVREGRFAIAPRSCLGCHLQPACRIPEKRGV